MADRARPPEGSETPTTAVAKPSKWHEGDTGRWDYRPRYTARRRGWKLVVEQMHNGPWCIYAEHRSGAVYNSLWLDNGCLAYKHANGAMRAAEAIADASRENA